MTFEEAKKEIKDREHAYWRGFKGLDEEHWHDQRYNPYYEGMSDGLEEASEILDKVEPSGNPEQLTLTELAHEMRKIFEFKYLTYDGDGDLGDFSPAYAEAYGRWVVNTPITEDEYRRFVEEMDKAKEIAKSLYLQTNGLSGIAKICKEES